MTVQTGHMVQIVFYTSAVSLGLSIDSRNICISAHADTLLNLCVFTRYVTPVIVHRIEGNQSKTRQRVSAMCDHDKMHATLRKWLWNLEQERKEGHLDHSSRPWVCRISRVLNGRFLK